MRNTSKMFHEYYQFIKLKKTFIGLNLGPKVMDKLPNFGINNKINIKHL